MNLESIHSAGPINRQRQWASALNELLFHLFSSSNVARTSDNKGVRGSITEVADLALRPFIAQHLLPRLDAALNQGHFDEVQAILERGIDRNARAQLSDALTEVNRLLLSGGGDSQSEALGACENRLSDLDLLSALEGLPEEFGQGEQGGAGLLALWAYGTLLLRRSELLGPLVGQEATLQEQLLRHSRNDGALRALVVEVFTSDIPFLGNDRDVLGVLVGHLAADFASGRPHKRRLSDDLDGLIGMDSPSDLSGPSRRGTEAMAVARAIIERRPRINGGSNQRLLREEVSTWLNTRCSEKVPGHFAVDVARSRAEAELGISLGRIEVREGHSIAPAQADEAVDGLLVWGQFTDGDFARVAHVDEVLFDRFLMAGSVVSKAFVESWRDRAADAFYAELTQDGMRSLLSSADPEKVIRGLPLRAFPRYFSVVARTAEDGATSGKERWRKGQDALFGLWSQKSGHGVLLRSRKYLPEERWTTIAEHYLDALRKRNAPSDRLSSVLRWMQNNGAPRTARMWESLVAATPDTRRIDEDFIDEIRSDLGSSTSFTAGLWTTIVARGLVVDRATDSQEDPVMAAIAAGERLLAQALNELKDMRRDPGRDDDDLWFSEREARRILQSYPRVGAYGSMAAAFNSALHRIDQANWPSLGIFTREMLERIAWAHASEGYHQGLSRVVDMIDVTFRDHDLRESESGEQDLRSHSIFTEWVEELSNHCSRVESEKALGLVVQDFERSARHGELDMPRILSAIDGRGPHFRAAALSRAYALADSGEPSRASNDELRDQIVAAAEAENLKLVAPVLAGTQRFVESLDLQSQQRIEALRSLLHLMTHDLGNIYSPALSASQVLLLKARQLEEELGASESLTSLVGRAEDLADKIAATSKRSRVIRIASDPDQVSKGHTVAEVVEALASGFSIRVDVHDSTVSSAGRAASGTAPGARTSFDHMSLVFILNTLLHNAEKYGVNQEGNGDVSVQIFLMEDGVTLGILLRDAGPGLPSEVVQRLEAYSPAQGPDSSDPGPRGLMSAVLTAEAWGGELSFDEEDDGRMFPLLRVPVLTHE